MTTRSAASLRIAEIADARGRDDSAFGVYPDTVRILVAVAAVASVVLLAPALAGGTGGSVLAARLTALVSIGAMLVASHARGRLFVALLMTEALGSEAVRLREYLVAAAARVSGDDRAALARATASTPLPAPSLAANLAMRPGATALTLVLALLDVTLVATTGLAIAGTTGAAGAAVVLAGTVALVAWLGARIVLAVLEDCNATGRVAIGTARDLADAADDAGGLAPGSRPAFTAGG